MALRVAMDLFMIALTAWFWPHCARPALIALRAPTVAHWLVLGVTVLTIIGYALVAAADIAQIGGALRLWIYLIVGFLWISVVGLGYLQNYALLLRLTGKSPPSHQQ